MGKLVFIFEGDARTIERVYVDSYDRIVNTNTQSTRVCPSFKKGLFTTPENLFYDCVGSSLEKSNPCSDTRGPM